MPRLDTVGTCALAGGCECACRARGGQWTPALTPGGALDTLEGSPAAWGSRSIAAQLERLVCGRNSSPPSGRVRLHSGVALPQECAGGLFMTQQTLKRGI